MNNDRIEAVKKSLAESRAYARIQRGLIVKQWLEFESASIKAALEAASADEIETIFNLVYKRRHLDWDELSQDLSRLFERWIGLCTTSKDMMNLLHAVQDKGYSWYLDRRVGGDCRKHPPVLEQALEKLGTMMTQVVRAALSKKELVELVPVMSFLYRWLEINHYVYETVGDGPAWVAYHAWSLRLLRCCQTLSELKQYKVWFPRKLYQSRLNLLYKQERGYSESSPRGGERYWMF